MFLQDFLLLVILDRFDPRADFGFVGRETCVKTAKGLVGVLGRVTEFAKEIK